MRLLIFFAAVLGLTFQARATTFYVDPVNGNINNAGSSTAPWSTLEEVFNTGKIETHRYSPLPYEAGTSQLIVRNEGAPVQGGDTIMLRTGLHGSIDYRGAYNLEYITIMADEGHTPVISFIDLVSAQRWKFIGLTVSSEPYGFYRNGRMVFFESHGWHGPSSDMEIRDCNLYSALNSAGWSATDWLENVSSGIKSEAGNTLVINNTLTNVSDGINLRSNSQAINNQVINFSKDGMRAQGSDILLEGNLIKNCYKVDDNHDDAIQSFTTPSNPFERVVIRNNTIINYDDPNQPLIGSLQGIGCFDGPYVDWIIENNVVMVNHWHGITLSGAFNCRIINNSVIDPAPDISPGPSWIRVSPHKDGTPSMGCIVANNVANTFSIQEGQVEVNNHSLSTYAEYAENFRNYASGDLSIILGSELIDAGDPAFAPEEDILGTLRLDGVAPDVGAFEFSATLPVSFGAFTGESAKYGNILRWSTLVEVNNEGFVIEYSHDGQSWENIGFVMGGGNSENFQAYEWLHPDPATTLSFYRLKQIDFDGAVDYSPVISVIRQEDVIQVNIYPNPAQDFVNYELVHPDAFKHIRLLDTSGKILEESQEVQGRFSLEGLPAGTYLLAFEGALGRVTKSVVKE